MSTLSAQEQLLFDAAKKALPKFLFDEDPNVQEVLAGFAKIFARVWDQVGLYIDGTRIATADETQIDQHAIDRGTRRRSGEGIDTLRARLRFLDDQVTPGAIVDVTTDVLTSEGLILPAGYPGLVELRRDRAFMVKPRLVSLTSIALAVSNQGTPGATSYSYAVLPQIPPPKGPTVQPAGYIITTATGNATLTGSNFNRLSWTPFPLAVGYDIFRYASAGTPSTTGLIGATAAATFDDTGLAGGSQNYLTFARYNSYLSRGYRMTGSGRASLEFIIILPYGTDAATASAVAEAVRLIKAGGIGVFTERRLNP